MIKIMWGYLLDYFLSLFIYLLNFTKYLLTYFTYFTYFLSFLLTYMYLLNLLTYSYLITYFTYLLILACLLTYLLTYLHVLIYFIFHTGEWGLQKGRQRLSPEICWQAGDRLNSEWWIVRQVRTRSGLFKSHFATGIHRHNANPARQGECNFCHFLVIKLSRMVWTCYGQKLFFWVSIKFYTQSAFNPQSAFYMQSAVCILYLVCILTQSAVCSLHFILTGCESYIPLNIYPKYPTPENTPQKIPLEHTKSRGAWGETTTPDFSCARKRMPATQARRYPDAPIPTSCSSKYLEST